MGSATQHIPSSAGTVVPECYKDDVENQYKNLKFDPRHPKTPEPMATKIGVGDCVPDIYPCAKFHYHSVRGFCPHICEITCQMFTRLVFICIFWVLSTRYRLSHCADFDDQYVKRRRFVPFGVPKTNVTFWPHFRQNTQIFVRFSTGQNFGSKRALTWGLRQ